MLYITQERLGKTDLHSSISDSLVNPDPTHLLNAIPEFRIAQRVDINYMEFAICFSSQHEEMTHPKFLSLLTRVFPYFMFNYLSVILKEKE